jgi:ATP-binding cassette subfamily B protein
VGPSGAGKTTALALLPRFYEPVAGHISIDGIDVADMTLASLRAQVGIVSQDVFLFGGTLREETVAYGRRGRRGRPQIHEAFASRGSTALCGLPHGLDTSWASAA